MNALQRLEIEEIQQIDLQAEETVSRFKIETPEQLAWAFRKLKAIDKQVQEAESIAAAEVLHINDWLRKELEPLDHSNKFFHLLISEYATEQRAVDPEFKKTKTPHGTVKFDKQADKWEYDDAKLLAYLKANDKELVKREVIEVPKKAELKKKFAAGDYAVRDGKLYNLSTGEEVDGVKILTQDDKLKVEV